MTVGGYNVQSYFHGYYGQKIITSINFTSPQINSSQIKSTYITSFKLLSVILYRLIKKYKNTIRLINNSLTCINTLLSMQICLQL